MTDQIVETQIRLLHGAVRSGSALFVVSQAITGALAEFKIN